MATVSDERLRDLERIERDWLELRAFGRDLRFELGLFTEPDGWHKVRLTVMSGPDFRTAHLVAGLLFPNEADAEAMRDRVLAALVTLGFAAPGGAPAVEMPVLRPVPEGGLYEIAPLPAVGAAADAA